MTTFRVLTGDPGTKNFALAVTEYSDGKIRSLGTKMLELPFHDLSSREAAEALHLVTREIRRLIRKYNVDAMYFERFQVRGKNASAIEGINVMLGVVLHLAWLYEKRSRLITASTWKNNCNRNNADGMKLDEAYKEFKLTSVHSPKAIHEFDASLIGVYAIFDQLVTKRKPFQGFSIRTWYEHLMEAPKL